LIDDPVKFAVSPTTNIVSGGRTLKTTTSVGGPGATVCFSLSCPIRLKYTDPDGRWFGIDDAVTGPADEIIVVGILFLLTKMGSKWAQRKLDAIESLINNILPTTVTDLPESSEASSSQGENTGERIRDRAQEAPPQSETNDKDSRLKGKPGDINRKGNKETKIGPDGRGSRERHYSDHGNPRRHTNPHDHDIEWKENGDPDFGPPINYPDGAPPFN
jgi:hypothetical protein